MWTVPVLYRTTFFIICMIHICYAFIYHTRINNPKEDYQLGHRVMLDGKVGTNWKCWTLANKASWMKSRSEIKCRLYLHLYTLAVEAAVEVRDSSHILLTSILYSYETPCSEYLQDKFVDKPQKLSFKMVAPWFTKLKFTLSSVACT